MYLPEERVWELFDNLGNKLETGSQVVFTFSKSQEKWVSKFQEGLSQEGTWDIQHKQGLTTGELDYNIFVITKK